MSSSGAWGGGIEMAALSKLRGVNVHVYERTGGDPTHNALTPNP